MTDEENDDDLCGALCPSHCNRKRCPRCNAAICSDSHMSVHCNDGKCVPVRIGGEEGDDRAYGRHLLATRDIAAGEDVFCDSPLVVGPWYSEHKVCLGCLKASVDLATCATCAYDVCSSCREGHIRQECGRLSEILRDVDLAPRGIKYPLATVTRMLSLDGEPRKSICFLSSGNRPVEKRHHLHRTLARHLGRHFDGEQVLRMIGIRYINAKTVSSGCVAIYPLFSLMNSDCSRANTEQIMDDKNFRLTIRAVAPIATGAEITTSYLPGCAEGQPRRRLKIWRSWQFVCSCERCSNGSDSGIRCRACSSGIAWPEQTNAPGSAWSCAECRGRISEAEVTRILDDEEASLAEEESGCDETERGKLHDGHFLLKSCRREE